MTAVCLSALVAIAPSSAAGGGTPVSATGLQADAAHDGVALSAGVGPPVGRLWSAPAFSPSYPVIADGLVIVTEIRSNTPGKVVTAFDARTGLEVWSHLLGGTALSGSPTYDRGRLFVVNFRGVVTAYDVATGAQLWAAAMPGQTAFSAPPTAANGVLYVLGIGSGATLYAVDESNGAVLWTAPNGAMDGAPAVSGDSIVLSGSCQTYAFDLSGNQRWVDDGGCSGGGGSTPSVWNGRVYSRAMGLVVSLDDGSTMGSFASESSPAFAGDLMYTINGGRLDAVRVTDGAERWNVVSTDPFAAAPLVMGDWVVVMTAGGSVYALDPNTGATEWSDSIAFAPGDPGMSADAVGVSGLAAAGPLLVVPAGNQLIAYLASGRWNVGGQAPSVAPSPLPKPQPVPTPSPATEPSSTGPPSPLLPSVTPLRPLVIGAASRTGGHAGVLWAVVALALVVGVAGGVGGSLLVARRDGSNRRGGTRPPPPRPDLLAGAPPGPWPGVQDRTG